jgi:hypothetical protein
MTFLTLQITEEVISLVSKWQNVRKQRFTNTNPIPNTNTNPTQSLFLNQSLKKKKIWRNVILRSAS